MDVTRIDQIAIAVEDLDEAIAFYERAFGLTVSSRELIESDGVEEAMLTVGGVSIQLLAPTREDSPIARYLARSGPGLHHLGFGVRSVSAALDLLHAPVWERQAQRHATLFGQCAGRVAGVLLKQA